MTMTPIASRPAYGWVVVSAAFVLTGLCFGYIALVAIVIKPFEAEFGWPRGDVSMAYTVATVATALAGVAFGRLSDRHGARSSVLLGAVVIGSSLLLLSRIGSVWQLYAVYALFGAFGFGAISVPLTAAVTNWFTVNRGLAVGISTAGGAVGQGTVPFIARYLISEVGWRESFILLGLGYLAVAVPLALLVRNPSSAAIAAAPGGPRATHEEEFAIPPRLATAWIAGAVVFCCICMSVPIVHSVALASDSGIEPQQAAGVLAAVMLAGAVGRIAIGRIADRIGPLNAYLLASFWQTATVYGFMLMASPVDFYLLAIVFGLGFGADMTAFLLTVRSMVPVRIAGTALAIVILFGWIGMGLGGYFGGVLFDLTGTYHASFALAAIAGIVNLCILMLLVARLRGRVLFRPAT